MKISGVFIVLALVLIGIFYVVGMNDLDIYAQDQGINNSTQKPLYDTWMQVNSWFGQGLQWAALGAGALLLLGLFVGFKL